MKAAGNTDFEIIFVSSDRDQEAFDGYYSDMPWLALPFEERAAKADLSKCCDVEGIPTLVIVGPDGVIINKDGRSALGKDPTGANFPWVPPAYASLEDCGPSINDTPTVIAFVEGASEELRTPIEAAIKTVAEATGRQSEMKFAIAQPGDQLGQRVRELCGVGEPTDTPLLMIIDLADGQVFYTCTAVLGADLKTTEQWTGAVNDFVAGFGAKTLEKQHLKF